MNKNFPFRGSKSLHHPRRHTLHCWNSRHRSWQGAICFAAQSKQPISTRQNRISDSPSKTLKLRSSQQRSNRPFLSQGFFSTTTRRSMPFWKNTCKPRNLCSTAPLPAGIVHRDRLFIPMQTRAETLKDEELSTSSVSHKLMVQAGLIKKCGNASGIYTMMPMGVKIINKIEQIIDNALQAGPLHCQKVQMPTLVNSSLWQKSGRWNAMGDELFRVSDRKHHAFCLGPTHEEAVTDLILGAVRSYRDLPLRIYQITSKFRDEARPRNGMVRTREFLMKDLYSFDVDLQKAEVTYKLVQKAYGEIFDRIGLPVVVARAHSGAMGGSMSHEYHVLSDLGEDHVVQCQNCNTWLNSELLPQEQKSPLPCAASANTSNSSSAKISPNSPSAGTSNSSSNVNTSCLCPNCNQQSTFSAPHRALELGHTFVLGTRYTAPFNATVSLAAASESTLLEMGCFGLGISRFLPVLAELYHDKEGLVWPLQIAPHKAIVLPISKSDEGVSIDLAKDLQARFPHQFGSEDLVLDHRFQETPGFRMNDAQFLGFPWTIVIGKKFHSEGKIEVQERATKQKLFLSKEELAGYIQSKLEALKINSS